jgi:hypothetical protein
MGVCVRVDEKAVADGAQASSAANSSAVTRQRIHVIGRLRQGRGSRAYSSALNPETGILTDPHSLLTRTQANLAYLEITPSMARRSIRHPSCYMKMRNSVNTIIPVTIVPSMVRRHKNHPRPDSVA